jgi:hypothetical protein
LLFQESWTRNNGYLERRLTYERLRYEKADKKSKWKNLCIDAKIWALIRKFGKMKKIWANCLKPYDEIFVKILIFEFCHENLHFWTFAQKFAFFNFTKKICIFWILHENLHFLNTDTKICIFWVLTRKFPLLQG